MASIIDPRCSIPLFLLEDKNIAINCGKIEGYVLAFILTILILIVCGVIYYFYMRKVDYKYKLLFIVSVGVILLLLWFGFPVLNGWLDGRKWMGYNEQIGSYIKQGFTRDQAIKKLQELYQTNIQANAINNAGYAIGNSLLLNAMDRYADR